MHDAAHYQAPLLNMQGVMEGVKPLKGRLQIKSMLDISWGTSSLLLCRKWLLDVTCVHYVLAYPAKDSSFFAL